MERMDENDPHNPPEVGVDVNVVQRDTETEQLVVGLGGGRWMNDVTELRRLRRRSSRKKLFSSSYFCMFYIRDIVSVCYTDLFRFIAASHRLLWLNHYNNAHTC